MLVSRKLQRSIHKMGKAATLQLRQRRSRLGIVEVPASKQAVLSRQKPHKTLSALRRQAPEMPTARGAPQAPNPVQHPEVQLFL